LYYKEKLIAKTLVGNMPGLIYAHNQEFSGGTEDCLGNMYNTRCPEQ